jgi:mycothiol system anti-sigma-R factor
MECEEVSAHLWEYLDRELGPEESSSITTHLQHCARCRPAYCCSRAFLELLARQRLNDPAPPHLLETVRRCLRVQWRQGLGGQH